MGLAGSRIDGCMRLPLPIMVVALLAGAAIPAFAGMGLRLGMSLDPDDFLVELHFQSKPVASEVRLVPSMEAGFGSGTAHVGRLDAQEGSGQAPVAGPSERMEKLAAGWPNRDFRSNC